MYDLALWITLTWMDIKMYRNQEKQYKKHYAQSLAFSQLAIIPFLVAAVLMMLKIDWGVHFLEVGITFSFIKGLLDSWVLLIEINR